METRASGWQRGRSVLLACLSLFCWAALHADIREDLPYRVDFFPLMQHFVVQKHPHYSSVASAVMVLNALGFKPNSLSAESYNQDTFFTPSTMQMLKPDTLKKTGLSMEKLAAILRQKSLDVYVRHVSKGDDPKGIISKLMTAVKTPHIYVIANYSRSVLGEKGSGHFSPLGAYDTRGKRFLLMDVWRFKDSPHWIPARSMVQAMQTKDSDANAYRGYLIVKRQVKA